MQWDSPTVINCRSQEEIRKWIQRKINRVRKEGQIAAHKVRMSFEKMLARTVDVMQGIFLNFKYSYTLIDPLFLIHCIYMSASITSF